MGFFENSFENQVGSDGVVPAATSCGFRLELVQDLVVSF
jgi:hypothetical protein